MSATTFGLSQIGQIAINAKDIQRATAFYRDTLGMQFLFDAPNMAFFDCGGVRLMLAVAEKPEFDHPASIIYYRVDDIEDAAKTLVARGVTIEGGPHLVHKTDEYELWMASLRDTEGNLLSLMEEKKP